MLKYVSKTGYIMRIATGECYEGSVMYLPSTDTLDNYRDCTQAEYEAWEEEQRRKYESVE